VFGWIADLINARVFSPPENITKRPFRDVFLLSPHINRYRSQNIE